MFDPSPALPPPALPGPADVDGAVGVEGSDGRHGPEGDTASSWFVPGGTGGSADAVPRPRRFRLGIDPPASTGIVVVAVLAVLVGGFYVWRSRPVAVGAPPAAVVSSAPSIAPASTPAASPTPSTLVVDVSGKVHDPGVVTLPVGSRVVDAVRAAGGARKGADMSTLNLARVLADGEQVLVGVPAPPAGAPGASGAADGSPARVHLNTATLAQLQELPGVGPVLGQRILDHRDDIGRYTSVDQLKDVSGIGDSRFADLEDQVRL